jgi:hypothetical protein
LPFLAVLVLLDLWALPPAIHAVDGCDAWRTRWIEAFQRLKESTESIRHTKEEPLASHIQHELSGHQNTASMARSVQSVLKERSTILSSERTRCRNLAAQENQTFEQWRRCAVSGNPRRGGMHSSGIEAASIERKKLLGTLPDLLLDEAYAQYKNYQAPAAATYSGYDQQTWGMSRNSGYGNYQGYGGYR